MVLPFAFTLSLHFPALVGLHVAFTPCFSTVLIFCVCAYERPPFGAPPPPPVEPPPGLPPPPGFPPPPSPATAALASRIPAPQSRQVMPGSLAVLRMRFTTACPRRPFDSSSAATPATWGVACEVPAMVSYLPSLYVERMSSSLPPRVAEPPGAMM